MPKTMPQPPTTRAVPRLIGLYSDAPQQGKSTVAAYLNKKHWYAIRPFAAPLKRIAAAACNELGIDPFYIWGDKDCTIPNWGDLTGRHLLQTLGTDWGRTHISTDIWLSAWQRGIAGAQRVVVDDVHFPNEADLVRSLGGQVWEVAGSTRLDGAAKERATAHASEGALTAQHLDLRLINSGTKRALYNAIELALSDTP